MHKNLVVVGGGFTGTRAAQRLERTQVGMPNATSTAQGPVPVAKPRLTSHTAASWSSLRRQE